MSIAKNLSNQYKPHGEQRRSSATLAAVNAQLVHAVNGDQSAVIYINGTGTFNATYNIQGSADGVNYFDLLAHPYSTASLGGTLPAAAQPLVSEAVNAAAVQRMLCVATGGLQAIRIRLTAYTSGSGDVTINSDDCPSVHPYLRDQKACTLFVTSTGVVGAAVTATLPAVVGLRHYIDNIIITRIATAALTASATPVVVTTTNLPGAAQFSMGADAGGIGVDKTIQFDFGSAGIAATAINTATTIVCPAYAGVIWRVNVAYRLGL